MISKVITLAVFDSDNLLILTFLDKMQKQNKSHDILDITICCTTS